MPVYELNDTVTLTLAGGSGDNAQLFVTAPDGTESTPAVTYSSPNWSGSLTASQYDVWEFAWRLAGSIVETGTFSVGGPWYGSLATLRKDVNRGASDQTADAQLARVLTAASRSVELWCDQRPIDGFRLADTATAKLFWFDRWTDWDCYRSAYRLPVREFGSLGGLVVETSDDGTTWTATTGYETFPENALDESKPVTHLLFAEFGTRVRVTAKWGWPAVPPSVTEATVRQASRLYRRKDSPEGAAGSSEWGIVRVPNLDPDVRQLLSHLRTEALIA